MDSIEKEDGPDWGSLVKFSSLGAASAPWLGLIFVLANATRSPMDMRTGFSGFASNPAALRGAPRITIPPVITVSPIQYVYGLPPMSLIGSGFTTRGSVTVTLKDNYGNVQTAQAFAQADGTLSMVIASIGGRGFIDVQAKDDASGLLSNVVQVQNLTPTP